MFKKFLLFVVFFSMISVNCYGLSLECDPVPTASGVVGYELSINNDILPGASEKLPSDMIRINHEFEKLPVGEYGAKARALDALGNKSDWSNEVRWEVKSPSIGNLTLVVSGNLQISVSNIAIPEIIIDNSDAETSQTGTWEVSGATDPYGADSVYSRDGATFTWHFTPSQSGIYEVSMWWTAWPSRSSKVPVDIKHSDGVATVYVDQQENGGQWNVQGQYYFESGTTYDITITSQPQPSSTCADAIKYRYMHR